MQFLKRDALLLKKDNPIVFFAILKPLLCLNNERQTNATLPGGEKKDSGDDADLNHRQEQHICRTCTARLPLEGHRWDQAPSERLWSDQNIS